MKYKLLSDVADYVSDKTKTRDLTLDNYISTENMLPEKAGIVRANNLPNVEFVTKYGPKDILTSNIRPYFKKIWHSNKFGGCSNDVLAIRAKTGTHPKFLYYVLSDDSFFNYSVGTSKGTKMPRGDKTAIMQYKIPCFCEEIEDSIAATLSSLDDKIELNDRIIANLEAQAQAIFKSWFVDFEPFQDGDFEESELGLIPKGWRVGILNEVCEKITDGSHFSPVETINGQFPMLSVKDMEAYGFNYSSCKWISEDDFNTMVANDCVPKLNDILVAKDGSYLKHVFIINEESKQGILSSIAIFRPKPDVLKPELLLYMLKNPDIQQTIRDNFVSGSALPRIVLKDFKKLEILIPSHAAQERAIDSFSKIRTMIENFSKQIITLAGIRDTLLPKLMSGEIEVPVEG